MKKGPYLLLVFLLASISLQGQASCSSSDEEESLAENLVLEAKSRSYYLTRKLALKFKEDTGISMTPEELSKIIIDIYEAALIDCVTTGLSFSCSSTATSKIAESFARDFLRK